MLDIGWTELLVIGIVLIVVVGPKDLPPMLRAFGRMTANLRKMAGEFRTQFDEALRETEMDDVRKTIADVQKLNPSNALRDAINPLRQMGSEIRSDLEKSTRVEKADVVAQEVVEGVIPAEQPAPAQPAPTVVPEPAVSLPSTPPDIPAPARAEPVDKPARPARKPAKSKPGASGEAPPAASARPKRARSAAVAKENEPAATVPATRKRAPKKAEAPKGDA